MNDRGLYRQHARAALDQLAKVPAVDPSRVAAVGYCFGGTGALELARSGAEVKAVVVFHADLTSPTPEDERTSRGVFLRSTGPMTRSFPP
jgi:dienelactone hydrolase